MEWDQSLLVAEAIINSRLTFKRRRHVSLRKLNPFRRQERRRRGVPLEGDLAEKMLDLLSEPEPEKKKKG